jgi:hypothetical protein
MTPFLRLTSLRIAAAMIMVLGLITIYRSLMHFHAMHGMMH